MPQNGVIPMDLKVIRESIYQIATVYPILPITNSKEIDLVQFMPKHEELWWTSRPDLDNNGCVIGRIPDVGRAISTDRVGKPLAPFTEFYTSESEDHLAPAIEHFDGSWGMSFHDAVNQVNVY